MTDKEIINSINALVVNAPEEFNKKLSAVDKKIFDFIVESIKELDLSGDKIKPTVHNLRLVGDILRRLTKVILDGEYKSDVADFLKAFNAISTLQNQYYSSLESKFKPTALLQAIREEAIESTLQQLTEDAVALNRTKVREVLERNITTGGSYKDLYTGVQDVVMGADAQNGSFSTHAKTLTITSVAQYSRHYSHTVGQGLRFEWFQYVGSTILTTRCFCHAMTEKRFFNIREVPKLLKGDFPEFKKRKCEIQEKTGLPDGFIKGTNESNFFTYAGGWNCQHSIFPVPASRVPDEIRAKFE